MNGSPINDRLRDDFSRILGGSGRAEDLLEQGLRDAEAQLRGLARFGAPASATNKSTDGPFPLETGSLDG